MSVRVASDRELYDLCVRTLAVHGSQSRDGFADEKIVGLFKAIRIAQHAAYAYSYDEEITLPVMEFPASAPPQAVLNPPAFKDLYDHLVDLGYNTFDRSGHGWLSDGRARLLNEIQTRTATKAARF